MRATTWMDLEGMMLSELSQSQKPKYRMIPLNQNLGTESKMLGGSVELGAGGELRIV